MAKYFLHFELFLLHLLILQVNSEPVFLDDTPKFTDIDTYLNAVENAYNYTESADLTHDIALGLLITRANMMHAYLSLNLSDDLRERTVRMSEAMDDTVTRDNFPLTGAWTDNLGLTSYFNLSHVPPLDQIPIEPVEAKFSYFEEYVDEKVDDNNIVPIPGYCIDVFAKLTRGNDSLRCPVDEKCIYYVFYGPDSGYGDTHRLLLMILLNSRGCYVFMPAEDEKMKQRLCSALYSQAQNIAHNDYKTSEILMRSVCLCSSLGYTQFFSRKWFSKILDLQADCGCFESTQLTGHSKNNHYIDEICAKNTTCAEISKKINCDPHLTNASMAALAVVARFTMQKCYGTLVK